VRFEHLRNAHQNLFGQTLRHIDMARLLRTVRGVDLDLEVRQIPASLLEFSQMMGQTLEAEGGWRSG